MSGFDGGRDHRRRLFARLVVTVRCNYERGEGPDYRSSRECNYRRELDMETLVWTRGRDFPLVAPREPPALSTMRVAQCGGALSSAAPYCRALTLIGDAGRGAYRLQQMSTTIDPLFPSDVAQLSTLREQRFAATLDRVFAAHPYYRRKFAELGPQSRRRARPRRSRKAFRSPPRPTMSPSPTLLCSAPRARPTMQKPSSGTSCTRPVHRVSRRRSSPPPTTSSISSRSTAT